jgi:ATP-dependent helicase HrpB
MKLQAFPIDAILPRLFEVLRTTRNGVLSAPPGAGKTTRVPPAVLGVDWMTGMKLIMLEPRRLAARYAAQFMASRMGETVGQTVGYRIRGESCVGRRTRIEVVTEGVLTRMLQSQPDLPGVAMVIFDEFHERSIHADLGLALMLDMQAHLRDDVRLLVMSATLDGLPVSHLLGNAPVVESAGQAYPVATHYLPFRPQGPIEPLVADAVRKALRTDQGDILVFLPGQREIRRVGQLLEDHGLPSPIALHMLYGDAHPDRQQAALAPSPTGQRKVILSTSIAETSLTIEGVTVVIDAGLARGPSFDPRRGMSGLTTGPVSLAAADQRRGRAGRQNPGVCYRLWTEDQHATLPRFQAPEILVADLAPLALDLAQWGSPEGEALRFLDPPPAAHLAQARELLERLGGLDSRGKLTAHGRAMADLPVHPRLAHMILRGTERGLSALACDVAALIEERDLLRGERDVDIDLHSRWRALHSGGAIDRSARERAITEARRLRGLIGGSDGNMEENSLGLLLAMAYPERIARRRAGQTGRYQLAVGTGAILPEWSLLAREEFLAIGHVDGIGIEARAFLAAPLRKEEILMAFADGITTKEEVVWSTAEEAVVARRVQLLGALSLAEQSIKPDRDMLRSAMLEGVKQIGIASLPWGEKSASLRSRSEWLRLRRLVPDEWPDLGDDHLLGSLPEWLGPFLDGVSRRQQLGNLDCAAIIRSRFSFAQLKELDRLAPLSVTAPTGSRITLDYSGEQPVLAVRLQEMFGQTDTPLIADGKAKVVIHLLSPAGRPLAVTQDLRSFWLNVYPEVRKEMRGRYPKHIWPEDPLTAKPTRRTVRKRRLS